MCRQLKALIPDPFVPLAEDLYCWYKGLGDRKFMARTGCAVLPPAALRYQVGSINPQDFLSTGQTCARDLETALQGLGKTFRDFRHALDFGCGCGRTLAWLRDYSGTCRFDGTDLNAKAIAWCRTTLPFAAFTVNSPQPPLDFPDATFDLVYAISVFTHMDESHQFAWLRELKRLVKRQAILLLSVHGEYCWRQLPPEEIAQVEARGFYAKPSRSLTAIFPRFYTNTYHTRDYIADRWSSYFTLRAYLPRGMNHHQDLVVLENPG